MFIPHSSTSILGLEHHPQSHCSSVGLAYLKLLSTDVGFQHDLALSREVVLFAQTMLFEHLRVLTAFKTVSLDALLSCFECVNVLRLSKPVGLDVLGACPTFLDEVYPFGQVHLNFTLT